MNDLLIKIGINCRHPIVASGIILFDQIFPFHQLLNLERTDTLNVTITLNEMTPKCKLKSFVAAKAKKVVEFLLDLTRYPNTWDEVPVNVYSALLHLERRDSGGIARTES